MSALLSLVFLLFWDIPTFALGEAARIVSEPAHVLEAEPPAPSECVCVLNFAPRVSELTTSGDRVESAEARRDAWRRGRCGVVAGWNAALWVSVGIVGKWKFLCLVTQPEACFDLDAQFERRRAPEILENDQNEPAAFFVRGILIEKDLVNIDVGPQLPLGAFPRIVDGFSREYAIIPRGLEQTASGDVQRNSEQRDDDGGDGGDGAVVVLKPRTHDRNVTSGLTFFFGLIGVGLLVVWVIQRESRRPNQDSDK